MIPREELNSYKITDIHTHMAWMEAMQPGFMSFMSSEIGENYHQFMKDHRDPESFLRIMDKSGIDRAVVLAEYSPATTGIASHEQLLDYCSASERLIPFANINPYLFYRPDQEFERLLNLGVKGLKLCPTYQFFYPNDSILTPLYHVALRADVPVLIHTGTSMFPGSRLKYGNPLLLDDIAVDFPELRLGMCHGGRGFWYEEAFSLLRFHKNLFIDIAGLPPQKLLNYFPEIERCPDQFLFGSDWPGIPKTITENSMAVRQLDISEKTKEKILQGNSHRFLSGNCSDPDTGSMV